MMLDCSLMSHNAQCCTVYLPTGLVGSVVGVEDQWTFPHSF